MGTLVVGRVGLDVTMSDPAEWHEGRTADSRETRIRGYLHSTSLTNTKALRTELLEQQGTIVALTYSLDSSLDGFYILNDVTIDSVPVSFMLAGLFPYAKRLEYILNGVYFWQNIGKLFLRIIDLFVLLFIVGLCRLFLVICAIFLAFSRNCYRYSAPVFGMEDRFAVDGVYVSQDTAYQVTFGTGNAG